MEAKSNGRRRMEPDKRREELLKAALKLAHCGGFKQVMQKDIAQATGCSPALVAKYFGERSLLPGIIMAAAIKYEDVEVLLQGLSVGDITARGAPEELRNAAKNRLDLEL